MLSLSRYSEDLSIRKPFLIASVPLANPTHIRYTEVVRWQHPGNAYQRAHTLRIMQIVQIAGNIFSEQIYLEAASLQRVGISHLSKGKPIHPVSGKLGYP